MPTFIRYTIHISGCQLLRFRMMWRRDTEGVYSLLTERMMRKCVWNLQRSHDQLHAHSPLSGKRRWNYCKWQNPISEIAETDRARRTEVLQLCWSEDSSPVCLLAAVHESLRSLSEVPLEPVVYRSSFTTNPPSEVSLGRYSLFLCALEIARPSWMLWISPLQLYGQAPPVLYHVWPF